MTLLTTVGYYPHALLAGEEILKYTLPTPERSLTTHGRLGLIHRSTSTFLPFCCLARGWRLKAGRKATELPGNHCSHLCPLELATQKCHSSEQIVPSKLVLNTVYTIDVWSFSPTADYYV